MRIQAFAVTLLVAFCPAPPTALGVHLGENNGNAGQVGTGPSQSSLGQSEAAMFGMSHSDKVALANKIRVGIDAWSNSDEKTKYCKDAAAAEPNS